MIGGHFPNRRIESGRGLEILSNCDRNSSREEIPTRKREKEGKIRNGGRFGERRVFALRGEASEIISTARWAKRLNSDEWNGDLEHRWNRRRPLRFRASRYVQFHLDPRDRDHDLSKRRKILFFEDWRNFYNPDSRVSRITRYTRKWLTSISNFSFEISKDRRWTPQFSIFSTIKKFFQETREETNLFPFHCSFFSGKEKKKEFTAKAEWDRNAIPRCYANRERKSNTKTYTKLATPVQLDPVNRASRGCWRCLRVGNGCRAREQRRWWNQDRPPSRRGYSSPLLPLIYISVGW